MTLREELIELKDAIENEQNSIKKLEGQDELLMKRLKSLGFKSIESAEKEIRIRTKENGKLLKSIKTEVISIRKQLK